jgi:hypothetical protein
VPLTLSGINVTTFNATALQLAIAAALGSSSSLLSMNVTFIDYPVTAGLQLTGLAAPPSAALAETPNTVGSASGLRR